MILLLPGRSLWAASLASGLKASFSQVEVLEEVEVTDRKQVRTAVEQHRPEAILMGGLDDRALCEVDPDLGFRYNVEAGINAAMAALEFSSIPVLLSSAELFEGSGGPFSEGDEPLAVSEWARQRRQGEIYLQRAASIGLILRSGPLVEYWQNYLQGAGKAQKPLQERQLSPLGAEDFARALKVLLEEKVSGIVHLNGPASPVSETDFFAALGAAERAVEAWSNQAEPRPAKNPTLLADRLQKYSQLEWKGWQEAVKKPLLDSSIRPKIVAQSPAAEAAKVSSEDCSVVEWAQGPGYKASYLELTAGENYRLPSSCQELQLHLHSGKLLLEAGEDDIILKKGKSHRLQAAPDVRLVAIDSCLILLLESSSA